jgi:hypothetical protein
MGDATAGAMGAGAARLAMKARLSGSGWGAAIKGAPAGTCAAPLEASADSAPNVFPSEICACCASNPFKFDWDEAEKDAVPSAIRSGTVVTGAWAANAGAPATVDGFAGGNDFI